MNIKDNLNLIKYASKFNVKETENSVLQIESRYGEVAAEIDVIEERISYYVTGAYNSMSDWVEINMDELNRLKEFCEAIVGGDTE